MPSPSSSAKDGNERSLSLFWIDDPDHASGQQIEMGPLRLMHVDLEPSDASAAAQDAAAGERATEGNAEEDMSEYLSGGSEGSCAGPGANGVS